MNIILMFSENFYEFNVFVFSIPLEQKKNEIKRVFTVFLIFRVSRNKKEFSKTLPNMP